MSRSGFEPYTPGPYAQAAERFLEDALDDLRSGRDAHPAISAAKACLLIDEGEQPEDTNLLRQHDDVACGEADNT